MKQLRGQINKSRIENAVYVAKIHYELNSTIGNKYAG
jgi:hypothetical protein